MSSTSPPFKSRRPPDLAGDAGRAWAQRIATGDAAAFNEMVQTYWPKLVAYVARIVGGVESAQDLVQDTFMRVWLHRAELRPDQSLKPYLYRVAHNRATDQLRRNRVRSFWLRRQQDQPSSVDPVNLDSRLRQEHHRSRERGDPDTP